MVDHLFADAMFGFGLAQRREQLLASARGRVLELDPHGSRLADGEFDTIVSSLALCSVSDLHETLIAVGERLASDGQLLFLEHIRLPGMRGQFQRLATPTWSRFTGGCHLDRDPIAAMRRAGLVVTDCERFPLPYGGAVVGAAVQGAARHSARAA